MPDAPDKPDKAAPRPLRVAELGRMLRDAAQELGPLRVEGEVRAVREASSGHVYFTLKDEEVEASLEAILFRTAPPRSRAVVREGARIVATCRATVFAARGRLQLEVERAELSGRGSLLEALEQRKRKLAAEGLFAAARKRPLPRDARVVGIVTSGGGAAIHDIVRVAFRRGPVRLLLAKAPVQGEGAAARLVRALDLVARAGVDAVILGRGGGSAEDLSAFDDEGLARKIAAMPVPVVSAVGHETDVSIADLVADARAATPSQAAEMLVPDASERHQLLRQLGRRIVRGMRHSLALGKQGTRTLTAQLRAQAGFVRLAAQVVDDAELRLERSVLARLREERSRARELEQRLAGAHPRAVLGAERGAIAALEARLGEGTRRSLASRRSVASELAARLGAMSPLAVLARGYAIATTADGRVVRGSAEVRRADVLQLRLHEGSLRVRVEGEDDAG